MNDMWVTFKGLSDDGVTHRGRIIEVEDTYLVLRCMGEDVIILREQVVNGNV